jgi:hypothetical protein
MIQAQMNQSQEWRYDLCLNGQTAVSGSGGSGTSPPVS